MNPLTIYAEYFPPTFREHVGHLETLPNYRNGFQDAVCAQEYAQWLKSPKWKLTAKLKRLIQPYCEKCGCRDHLQVHHRTYDHLGIEILHLEDLAVLCEACHFAEHNQYEFAYADQRRTITHDRVPTQIGFRFEPGRTSVQRHRVTWPPGRP